MKFKSVKQSTPDRPIVAYLQEDNVFTFETDEGVVEISKGQPTFFKDNTLEEWLAEYPSVKSFYEGDEITLVL